jgi:hypothetical protein
MTEGSGEAEDGRIQENDDRDDSNQKECNADARAPHSPVS